jgi:hypothetical protein
MGFGEEFEAFVLNGLAKLAAEEANRKFNFVRYTVHDNADSDRVEGLFEGNEHVERLEDIVGHDAEIHSKSKGFFVNNYSNGL